MRRVIPSGGDVRVQRMADGCMPRVLLVSHTAGRLGAERSLLTLAERLRADRLAEIMVLLPGPGPLLDDLAARKIETRLARYYPWVGFTWTRFAVAKRFARLPLTVLGAISAWPGVRRWNPDLIYINTVFSPMGLILAALLGKPCIWHLREWISAELNTRFDLGQAAVMALLNRSKAEIIFNSQAIADIYGRHLPNLRPAVVYNGFDFAGLPAPDGGRRFDKAVAGASRVRLAVIGSVQPVKGQEDAIRALPRLLAAGVPAHLEIIGQGRPEYVASLRSLAAELSVADQISFRGYVADATSQLDGIAAVLVPSRYEPFGRVAAEAQAHGVPVVAAAVGGLSEIVQDNKTGLLFPAADVEQLAARTVTLLQDRGLYDSLVTAAWRHATEVFTHDRYAAGVWAAMLRAMDESAAGGADGG